MNLLIRLKNVKNLNSGTHFLKILKMKKKYEVAN